MDGKTLARLGTIIFVAVAITATAIEMTRKEERPAAVRRPSVVEEAADPLREGQRRCQQMGDAAARDSACLAVWAETRDRFFGLNTAPRHADEGR